MKLLLSAPRIDFDLYIARDDTQWVEREPGDLLASVYDRGFLPYSGAMGLQGIFYSARSARIELPEFRLSSENRRIARKFDGQFDKKRLQNFTPTEDFYSFCLNYFTQKHGEHAMPRARLETIMNSGLITDIMLYRSENNQIAAYVLEVAEGDMAHFWFSFYDLAYAQQSLGLWLMLDSLRDAHARGLRHYYLGTVYGRHALYKTNFAPLEWWGEAGWSRDVRRLKELA